MITGDVTGLGIGFAVLFIVWFVVGIGSQVMLIVALVDIVRRPEWQWKLASQEKTSWLLLVILVILVIPSLIYWFTIRKKPMAVEVAAASGQYGQGQVTYTGWQPVLVNPALPPPGWYPDISGQAELRWWDGARWTTHTSTGSPPSS